jgi:hypothetical protein
VRPATTLHFLERSQHRLETAHSRILTMLRSEQEIFDELTALRISRN